MLGVQDGGFLPEGPLDLECDDLGGGIGKNTWREFGYQRGDTVAAHRALIGKGAKFDSHFAGDVAYALRQGSRIGEKQHRRMAGRVEPIVQPRNATGGGAKAMLSHFKSLNIN